MEVEELSLQGALSGVSVVEWGTLVTAPYCAKLLADLGADVIKVEEPAGGDVARYVQPSREKGTGPEQGGLFQYVNAGKRSVLIDPEGTAGRDALLGLIARADLFVHNQAPDRVDRLGLDFTVLARLNAQLVVTSLTPFGAEGPYRNWRGNNLVVSHIAGLAKKTTWEGLDLKAHPPLKPAGYYADFMAGLAGAVASMGGLMARDVLGKPQFVDVSAWEAAYVSPFPTTVYPPYEGYGVNFRRDPGQSAVSGREPHRYMACGDGYIWVAVLQPRHWEQFTQVLGVPELAEDRRFLTPLDRGSHWDALEPILSEKLGEWPREKLFHECQANGIPVVPAYHVMEAVDLDHRGVTNFLVSVDHPVLGTVEMPRNPCRLSETPPVSRPAPLLGEHSAEILGASGRAGDLGPLQRSSRANVTGGKGSLPLSDLRVLDFSWVLAAPLATQMLSRFGAEVIKVESERNVDIARVSPPFADGVSGPENSGYFSTLNVGKKTFTVDLRQAQGLAIVKDLVRICDVVVENFSPGTLERLGLGYDELRKIRPDMIFVSVSAFGQTGALRSYRAFGLQLFALSGLSVLSSPPDAPPAVLHGGGADPLAAYYATLATLAAIQHRRTTGQGQQVDISMLDATMAHFADAVMEVTLNKQAPLPVGNAEDGYVLADCFPCKGEDAWVAITIRDRDEWHSLCRAIGDSTQDEDVPIWGPDGPSPEEGRQLRQQISTWTRESVAEDAMKALQAAGVPAAVSYDDMQIQSDPQFQGRGFMELIDHHEAGQRYVASVPWRISGIPHSSILKSVPRMNEHANYVLRELLGLSQEQVDELASAGVVPGSLSPIVAPLPDSP